MTNGVSLRERRKKGSRLKREIQQRKEIDFFLSLEQCSRNSIFKEGDFLLFFFSLSILEIVREIVRVWIVQNRRDRCDDRTGVFLSGVLFSL